MYTVLPTGELKGILIDYDLASWDERPTTNRDRTGTIPFMALEVVRNGFREQVEQIPRLYRHDSESFIWVLAYITIVSLEYENYSVKISRPPALNPWFAGIGHVHLSSKQTLCFNYGYEPSVTEPHKQYVTIIRYLLSYWAMLYNDSLALRFTGSTKPKEDDPKGTLERLVGSVEEMGLGKEAQTVFSKVKGLLLKAIETPKVM